MCKRDTDLEKFTLQTNKNSNSLIHSATLRLLPLLFNCLHSALILLVFSRVRLSHRLWLQIALFEFILKRYVHIIYLFIVTFHVLDKYSHDQFEY